MRQRRKQQTRRRSGGQPNRPERKTRERGAGKRRDERARDRSSPEPVAAEAVDALAADDTEELPLVTAREEAPEAGPVPPLPGEGAVAAFDALYDRHAAGLIRQAYLLTGRPRRAQEAVERAFQLAWQRWPEVAVDRDPAGWVRAAAYEYALSPWHRMRPWGRAADKPSPKAPAPPPAGPGERALLSALLELPAAYRRTLLLHDGVGLGLCETAAEIEASTPATAGRLTHARETVAGRLPELGLEGASVARQGEILHERLAVLAAAQPVAPSAAAAVRGGSERSARRITRGAFGMIALLATATAFVLLTAPNRAVHPPEVTVPAAPATSAAPGTRADGGRPENGGEPTGDSAADGGDTGRDAYEPGADGYGENGGDYEGEDDYGDGADDGKPRVGPGPRPRPGPAAGHGAVSPAAPPTGHPAGQGAGSGPPR
ncbi:RNA polymerase sigma factor [Streptomyces sp. NPDC050161]|uniref:RNA polymerase sigma factor n=1 Tax=Streptomyces sp. NPDC050161 TaxID=3365604 RepID=UPI00379E110D